MSKRRREIAQPVNPNSDIVNSSCSHSIPSGDESVPPDIRNWFSSYVYESPVLGSEDKLGCFDSELNQIDGTKVPSSSSLLPSASDLSEPPDIRNWFSSYVYESPILDNEDEANCFVDGKGSTENVDVDFKRQNQLGTEEIPDHCLGKGKSVTKVSDDKSSGCKLMKSNNPAPLAENIISGRNDGDYIQNTKSSSSSPGSWLGNKSYKEDTKDKSCTKEAGCISNANSETDKTYFSKVPLASNTGNKENESATNGFISTKKNKYTKENHRKLLKACQENHSECVRKPDLNFPSTESQSGVTRSPLHEKTNFQYKTAVPETTGKWRCPQRSKPDLGPPLKQLRLEQWVRRVQ